MEFGEVSYQLSKTRDLIADVETYSYRALKKFFRKQRRGSPKVRLALVVPLYCFRREMEARATYADNR